MLFNSQEFLFVFLPITLLGFYLLGAIHRQWAILWLILISLVFYGWWRPVNILIIGPSIIINYALATTLLQLNQDGGSPRLSPDAPTTTARRRRAGSSARRRGSRKTAGNRSDRPWLLPQATVSQGSKQRPTHRCVPISRRSNELS